MALTTQDFVGQMTHLTALFHAGTINEASYNSQMYTLWSTASLSTTALAQKVSNTVENCETLFVQLDAWAVGTAIGGPSSDGYYPITGLDGLTISVPSPAKVMSVNGLIKTNARLATNAALPTHTRTGSVLTASANGALTVDSVTVALNDRILYKNGAAENGVYVVTQAGDSTHPWILTRSADSSAWNDLRGARITIEAGTIWAGFSFISGAIAGGTINTTSYSWSPSARLDLAQTWTVGQVISTTSSNKLTLTGGTTQNGITWDTISGGKQWYAFSSATGFTLFNNTDAVNLLTVNNLNTIALISAGRGLSVTAAGRTYSRYDDNGNSIGLTLSNYGMTAGAFNNQGVTLYAEFGSAAVLTADAGYITWYAGDTWATTGTQSSKFTLFVKQAGTDTQVFLIDGTAATFSPRDLLRPNMPAFLATQSVSTSNNVTGDGTTVQLIMNTEVFDRSNSYTIGTGFFTAPATGLYAVRLRVAFANVQAAHTRFYIAIVAGGITYQNQVGDIAPDADGLVSIQLDELVSLTAGQTLAAYVNVGGSTKVVGIQGNGGVANWTSFSAWQVG
jgi:hypothetical protein